MSTDIERVRAGSRRLTPELRVALDAIRALAALYVVVHHVVATRDLPAALTVPFRFGQEAVILFFLLSGFVIFANERGRVSRPRGYFLRRLRRIYPALVAAVIVSTLIELWNGDLGELFSARELIGTLASLQDVDFLKPGVIVDPYLGNDPLWSLSYEVAFYLVFPSLMRLWNRSSIATVHLVGMVSVLGYASFIAFPNHFSLVATYLVMWWIGALLAHLYMDGEGARRAFLVGLGWLSATLGVTALALITDGFHGIGFHPALEVRHFAFAVAVTLLALFGPAHRIVLTTTGYLAPATTWVVGISYELYVLHFPVLMRWDLTETAGGFLVGVVVLVAIAWAVPRAVELVIPRAPRT
jgi:peptidoglycan/LPS O-acetylase OafA/YrhL